ncbi:MAG: transposase, partial [Planctomycetota bacterium]
MSDRSRSNEAGSMMDSRWLGIELTLTDQQWSLISDLFPDRPVGPHGGRPRVSSRACIEGILWVLR